MTKYKESISTDDLNTAPLLDRSLDENHDDLVMTPLEYKLARSLSIHNIITLNRFYDLIVKKSNNEEEEKKTQKNIPKFKMAHLHHQLGVASQSTLKKQLDHIQNSVEDAFNKKLFLSFDRQYEMTDFGESFIKATKEIERAYSTVNEWLHKESEFAVLRIAVNTFSYHAFRSIEDIMKKRLNKLKLTKPQEVEYAKKFINMRSTEIFDYAKHSASIDIGISESFSELKSGRQLEVIEISKSSISLMSNFKLEEVLDIDNSKVVSVDGLKKIPLILGDTKSFFEYLYALGKGEKTKPHIAAGMSPVQLEAYVKQTYNVVEMSTSVNLMMDVLLTGTEKVAMLTTPEVKEHLLSLESLDAEYGKKLEFRKQRLFEYSVEDQPLTLKKYAIRKLISEDRQQKSIAKHFWEACHEFAN